MKGSPNFGKMETCVEAVEMLLILASIHCPKCSFGSEVVAPKSHFDDEHAAWRTGLFHDLSQLLPRVWQSKSPFFCIRAHCFMSSWRLCRKHTGS